MTSNQSSQSNLDEIFDFNTNPYILPGSDNGIKMPTGRATNVLRTPTPKTEHVSFSNEKNNGEEKLIHFVKTNLQCDEIPELLKEIKNVKDIDRGFGGFGFKDSNLGVSKYGGKIRFMVVSSNENSLLIIRRFIEEPDVYKNNKVVKYYEYIVVLKQDSKKEIEDKLHKLLDCTNPTQQNAIPSGGTRRKNNKKLRKARKSRKTKQSKKTRKGKTRNNRRKTHRRRRH